uniref:Uncharacterized protein n=1 Tax=Leersia perrieri TaxID=77586 RepID=A0A0D9WDY9_9ORYZ
MKYTAPQEAYPSTQTQRNVEEAEGDYSSDLLVGAIISDVQESYASDGDDNSESNNSRGIHTINETQLERHTLSLWDTCATSHNNATNTQLDAL